MLAWTLNTYKGEELMGHPDLKSHTANLGPLLPPRVLNRLQEEYLKVLTLNGIVFKVITIFVIEYGIKLYRMDAKYFDFRETGMVVKY